MKVEVFEDSIVMLSPDGSFYYQVPPKCGCTTVMNWVKKSFGSPEDYISMGNMHGFQNKYHTTLADAKKTNLPIIAIHRDPIERLRSCYDHWVVKRHVVKCDSFADFVQNIPLLDNNKTIHHHIKGQASWLGVNTDNYNYIIPSNDMYLFKDLVENITGRVNLPDMPHDNRAVKPSCVTEDEAEKLRMFTGYDYLVGWDGKLLKI